MTPSTLEKPVGENGVAVSHTLLRATHTDDDLKFTPKISTGQELIDYAKTMKVRMLDLTFTDVPGRLHHTTKPIHELEGVLKDGGGFDGSSIPGFRAIQESDMLLIPDASTAILDPFVDEEVLSVLCDVRDPLHTELFDCSPRTIAHRAEKALLDSGIADIAYFGPEAEFFVFDRIRFAQGPNHASYKITSSEGGWGTDEADGEGGNLGYKTLPKQGYYPAAPFDTQMKLRTEMVRTMEQMGIEIETHHHEVASAGQAEIDMKFDSLLKMADKMMRYKYTVRNVARKHNKVATFMPKPVFADNGSGMHVHQSLWKDGKPLFAGEGYAGLSEMALRYIGGLFKHAKALAAICNPSTNSYKRLTPGFEAPVNLIYSARNRSAAVRIPMYSSNPKSKRVEFRMPDPLANPYLAFSALLLAGMDGIQNKLDPGASTDENLYDMSAADQAKIGHAPESLGEALDALEKDHEFITKSGVFTEEFLQSYIASKRAEVADEAKRPTPSEFARYFNS